VYDPILDNELRNILKIGAKATMHKIKGLPSYPAGSSSGSPMEE